MRSTSKTRTQISIPSMRRVNVEHALEQVATTAMTLPSDNESSHLVEIGLYVLSTLSLPYPRGRSGHDQSRFHDTRHPLLFVRYSNISM